MYRTKGSHQRTERFAERVHILVEYVLEVSKRVWYA